MKVKLKVKRSNGESGDAAYSRYEIETADNATVLDALIQVREYEDGTLGLRCSCRAAICGSCSMRVDGQSRLACRAKVIAITRGKEDHEIVVEPMGNMPVIKDLIVDMDAVHWKKVQRVVPWLLPACLQE
jgi:succinate dehydrogenase / fumarate reductase iron-sulfur subunit